MKPIETVYKGYRFRSRLEARWAMFFEAARIRFEYEAQGFDLPSGKYLPDFYLPDYGGFVEVKPLPMPPLDDKPKELLLMQELCRASKKPCIIVYGDPLNVSKNYESFAIGTSGAFSDFSFKPREGFWGIFDRLLDNDWDEPLYHKEALKARQARFEHGEAPA